MAFFFLWYLVLFQRYSSFPIMQMWSLMTSSVVQVQWCDTKLRISLSRDVALYKIYQMVQILMLLWQHALFQSPASSKLNIIICSCTGHQMQLKMSKRRLNEGGTAIRLRWDQVFCLVESQMVIFNFEEAGDWNRACCHSNIKMCTIWYILKGATSLLSFNSIASILAEIFLILCHTTVLAQPIMSSVTTFA